MQREQPIKYCCSGAAVGHDLTLKLKLERLVKA
jgi:hypothetical protein